MALSRQQIECLVTILGGERQIERMLSGELAVAIEVNRTLLNRRVTVPADADFTTLVERAAFGWANPDITAARFPLAPDQTGSREQRLYHFARSLSSEDVMREIRVDGFEPAGIGDLLAFAATWPDDQRRFPVVSMARVSDIDNKPSVAALWFDGVNRTFDTIGYEGDWHRNYRFLGARPAPTGLQSAESAVSMTSQH